MAITVKVLSKPDKNFVKQQETFVLQLAEKHTFILSKEAEEVIKKEIAASIERQGSTGNLASKFFSEKISQGYGVGNIDLLNREVPYWAWQNDGVAGTGRRIPPGSDEVNNRGAFQPGVSAPGAGTGQRWQVGGGPYPIYPKNPIKPKFFIEHTISDIFNRLDSIIGKVKE